VSIESDPFAALESDVLVLPGVGNFVSAAERLAPVALTMRDAIMGGHPTLGICLGMQLLFESSEEGPATACVSCRFGTTTRRRARSADRMERDRALERESARAVWTRRRVLREQLCVSPKR
jgi:glutamine amidotransferase